MNELSARARELVRKMDGQDHGGEKFSFPSMVSLKLIEQALLAEHRLAMETCANTLSIEAKKWDWRTANRNAYEYASQLLRAAAGKEVGK